MSKTRNLSDLLDANGDVKSTALDNVPASNDASALTTGTLDSARLGTVTNFTSTGIDDNATSTAVTIDSSQNVLVGTTDNSLYNNSGAGNGGVMLANTTDGGRVDIARNGVNLIVNRLASDGLAIEVKKDGTTIGSIGSKGGTDLIVGSGDTGLRFRDADNAIWGFNTSTNVDRDNAIDLGASGARFKDGYFGGTVTANAFSGDGSALTGIGGNTPAFAVHAGGNTVMSANTFTHINFGTELVDTDNAFASSAFTVPSGKGGRYFIGGVVVFDQKKDNVQLAVTVGGTDNYDGQNWRIIFGNDFQMASVSYVLNLSAGDVVRLGGETNTTTNLSNADSYSRTKFWGFKI